MSIRFFPLMGSCEAMETIVWRGLVCCFFLACLAVGYYYYLFEELLRSPVPEAEPLSADSFPNLQVDDPQLLQHLQNSILHPPSHLAYNLSRNHTFDKFDQESSQFYMKQLLNLFDNTSNGFFIEAGALDGETMSNTLWLELKRNWTGLLVEPDPSSFGWLLMKQRKVWSAKSCLSVEKYPRIETLSFVSEMLELQVNNSTKSIYMKGNSFINKLVDPSLTHQEKDHLEAYNATCFPLASFLLALNITKVDLWSLDVEFIEEKILENFDFDRFDIQVIFIEWQLEERVQWLLSFMQKRSYIMVENIVADFVFVKTGSKYEDIVRRKNLIKPLKVFF